MTSEDLIFVRQDLKQFYETKIVFKAFTVLLTIQWVPQEKAAIRDIFSNLIFGFNLK